MLRSAPMTLCQLVDTNDAARGVVCELGELGLFEFRDMNGETPMHKRVWSDEVRRCEEMTRRLDFVHTQLARQRIAPAPHVPGSLQPTLDGLDAALRSTQAELVDFRSEVAQVAIAHNALKEHEHVLQLGGQLFAGAQKAFVPPPPRAMQGGLGASLLENAHPTGGGSAGTGGEDMGLRCTTGVLRREAALTFARAVHRVTRGNCIVHDCPINEPLLGQSSDGRAGAEPEPVAKNFFMLLYSGSVIEKKVLKIMGHFGATRYAYPEALGARQALQARTRMQLVEMDQVLAHTQGLRRACLRRVAAQWAGWRHALLREKATLHCLNLLLFEHGRKVFVAQGWVPTAELGQVAKALQRAARAGGGGTCTVMNVVETDETPPTFLRTNKFTAGFQALVDTYGIPRYREMNPGAFAIVLFPFLFAIMFGDVGHGSLLLMLALYFIYNEEKMLQAKLDDIVGMAFGGRYVLLLNSIFAIYVGFVYNEAFAVPLGLFTSAYHPVGHHNATSPATAIEWDGTVYPFGVDPMWHRSTNKMSFFNSYKMKVSIVFGVAQMTLGISLSLLNHLRTKNWRSIWFGFVPEITFFISIFGYLVFMIFRKWSVDWLGTGAQPPSLLNTLISMFMAPGSYTETDRLFAYQEYFQLFLLLLAVVAVPFLLLPKPILYYLDCKKAAAAEASRRAAEPEYRELAAAAERGGGDGGDDDEEDEGPGAQLGEVVVHQVIHTIEFVLGSISNTASYLRLWALSLAHSQLSELFWDKVMKEQGFPAAKYAFPWNGVVFFLAFGTWLLLNVGVIMVMENLSSFLHALRLQWVEFQNKFYAGDGRKFAPFSFAKVDSAEMETEDI